MSYRLGEIASQIDAACHGDPDCMITGIMSLEKAISGQISFFGHLKYSHYLKNTRASAVILHPQYLADCPSLALTLENPYLGFAKAAKLFQPPVTPVNGLHPTVVVGTQCQIHPSASVGPYTVIGDYTVLEADVVIGDGCSIGTHVHIGVGTHVKAHVILYDGTQIGRNVLIHSGTVIGSDGFGFVRDLDQNQWVKIPQLGKVKIGHAVEIGANVTIDCGTLDDTVIGDRVLLDNQIQIAHNVFIGEGTAIAGCTGIAGSTRIGKNCQIGGGVCIVGHLEIVDDVIITAMSGVDRSIRRPGLYGGSGMPVKPYVKWRKELAALYKLEVLFNRVKQLEEKFSD